MMYQMNVDFVAGAISFGGGSSEWWVQLSTAVVFGLGFSTIMTLLVTPVWLALPETLHRAIMKKPIDDAESGDLSETDKPGSWHPETPASPSENYRRAAE